MFQTFASRIILNNLFFSNGSSFPENGELWEEMKTAGFFFLAVTYVRDIFAEWVGV